MKYCIRNYMILLGTLSLILLSKLIFYQEIKKNFNWSDEITDIENTIIPFIFGFLGFFVILPYEKFYYRFLLNLIYPTYILFRSIVESSKYFENGNYYPSMMYYTIGMTLLFPFIFLTKKIEKDYCMKESRISALVAVSLFTQFVIAISILLATNLDVVLRTN